ELETVVLKAMARNPDERYPTAQALADDLNRFLEARPVLARRPTLAQVMSKWMWRHRAVVTAASAGLLLAVIVLAVSVVLLIGANRREIQKRQEAEKATRAAEDAFDYWYVQVVDDWLKDTPHLEPKQRHFLERSLSALQALSAEQGADPARQVRLVDTL